MERERLRIVRLHPALNGNCEGEHPHFRPQPGGQLVCAPFAQGGGDRPGDPGVLEQPPLLKFAVRRDNQDALGGLSPLAAGLAGSGRPLVISGATIVTPGRAATERDELIATGPVAARIANMRAALAAAAGGVRSCLVMLPRSVHGQGERHGFVPQLIAMARTKGVSGYIGDGASRWPAVHVTDAATLYRLAVEQAPAGAVLYAVGEEGVPVREIADAIGRHLNLPARSLPAAEYEGMLVPLLSTDMPASSTITQELLGWKPAGPGLIEDIEQGHYFS